MDLVESSSVTCTGLVPRLCVLQNLGARQASKLLGVEKSLLNAHVAGIIGDRFNFFSIGPAVSIGCHQAQEREARTSYCVEAGIEVVRRLTAGGALYLDQGQQIFSLTTDSQILGQTMAQRLQNAARILAEALRELGVETEFKAPNDLQTSKRQKIASVFLAERAGSTVLTGVVIGQLDLKAAMQALLVPTEKLTVTGLEHARERMTSLVDELGGSFDPSQLREAIAQQFSKHLNLVFVAPPSPELQIDGDELEAGAPSWPTEPHFLETKDKVALATWRMTFQAEVQAEGDVLRSVAFATDAHISPSNALRDLAQILEGAVAKQAVDIAAQWFAGATFEAVGCSNSDILRLIERAVAKLEMQRQFDLSTAQASGVMLAGDGLNPEATLAKATVMLVPYCAKPNWCKWRHTVDCVECGACEVGDAYAMARHRNMEVVTITNFEHLSATLGKMKIAGVESYVGMCCGEFFLKRHHAFRDSGMDAVLLDIEGATCYELKQEQLAYAGEFKADAKLDLDAVRKVMAHVPVQSIASKPCLNSGARPAQKFKAAKDAGLCAGCACNKALTSPANAVDRGHG